MIKGRFYIQGNSYDISAVEDGGFEGRKPEKLKIANQGHYYYNVSEPKRLEVSVPLLDEHAPYAYKAVLKHAGASHRRDAIDRRIVKEVRKGTAGYKGSITGLPGIIDSENDVLK